VLALVFGDFLSDSSSWSADRLPDIAEDRVIVVLGLP
jgi:hypothetical protein